MGTMSAEWVIGQYHCVVGKRVRLPEAVWLRVLVVARVPYEFFHFGETAIENV